MDEWQERISINPVVCHGRAYIHGTRVMAPVILDNLAASVSRSEILASHPTITDADIDAALAYAADGPRAFAAPACRPD